MPAYFIREPGMQLSERVTAKNFHVRYKDGNCDCWQVVIKGKVLPEIYRTNYDCMGLWCNGVLLMHPKKLKFSLNRNYRMKQIRKIMIKIYCDYGE